MNEVRLYYFESFPKTYDKIINYLENTFDRDRTIKIEMNDGFTHYIHKGGMTLRANHQKKTLHTLCISPDIKNELLKIMAERNEK